MILSKKFLLAVCLLSIGLSVNVFAKGESSDSRSEELQVLLNEFLDASVNPECKLPHYIEKLKSLLKEDKKYAKFCKDILEIQSKKMTNARLIGLKLIKHKSVFPKPVQSKLEKMPLPKLLECLNKRIK